MWRTAGLQPAHVVGGQRCRTRRAHQINEPHKSDVGDRARVHECSLFPHNVTVGTLPFAHPTSTLIERIQTTSILIVCRIPNGGQASLCPPFNAHRPQEASAFMPSTASRPKASSAPASANASALRIELSQQEIQALDQRLGFRNRLFAVGNLLCESVPFATQGRELLLGIRAERRTGRRFGHAPSLAAPSPRGPWLCRRRCRAFACPKPERTPTK